MVIANYYVDLDGKTYRVALTDGGHPMIVVRRDLKHDTGRALDPAGKIGRKLVAAAREQQSQKGLR